MERLGPARQSGNAINVVIGAPRRLGFPFRISLAFAEPCAGSEDSGARDRKLMLFKQLVDFAAYRYRVSDHWTIEPIAEKLASSRHLICAFSLGVTAG